MHLRYVCMLTTMHRFRVLLFSSVLLSSVFAASEDSIDWILKDAFGAGVWMERYRGQMISIRDSRTLNCTFPALQPCCWYNEPASSADNLQWVRAKGVVDNLRTAKKFGDEADRIKPPFVLASAGSSTKMTDAAVLVSCAIPCQCGSGQLTLSHWISGGDLNVCTTGVTDKDIAGPCSLVTGSTNSTVMVPGMSGKPFMIVLKASNFGPGGIIAVDNIIYSARIPPGCSAC